MKTPLEPVHGIAYGWPVDGKLQIECTPEMAPEDLWTAAQHLESALEVYARSKGTPTTADISSRTLIAVLRRELSVRAFQRRAKPADRSRTV